MRRKLSASKVGHVVALAFSCTPQEDFSKFPRIIGWIHMLRHLKMCLDDVVWFFEYGRCTLLNVIFGRLIQLPFSFGCKAQYITC